MRIGVRKRIDPQSALRRFGGRRRYTTSASNPAGGGHEMAVLRHPRTITLRRRVIRRLHRPLLHKYIFIERPRPANLPVDGADGPSTALLLLRQVPEQLPSRSFSRSCSFGSSSSSTLSSSSLSSLRKPYIPFITQAS